MSIFLISFLASASATAWLYSKFFRKTGGNNQTALIGGVVIGVGLFIILFFTLSAILPK